MRPACRGGATAGRSRWARVGRTAVPTTPRPPRVDPAETGANVTLRAGSHELVFKHPQHGELKQTVVVKAGETGRVTVNMVR